MGTITYFTRRDVISDNPLRDRLGYNNVCVGLDTKPASYVAALLWPFLSYFNIRAAWVTAITELTLDEKHSSTASKCITVVSSIVSLVSTCILAVLFLFPPVPDAQAVWIHTGIYVQFIIGLCSVLLCCSIATTWMAPMKSWTTPRKPHGSSSTCTRRSRLCSRSSSTSITPGTISPEKRVKVQMSAPSQLLLLWCSTTRGWRVWD